MGNQNNRRQQKKKEMVTAGADRGNSSSGLNERAFYDIEIGSSKGKIAGTSGSLMNLPTVATEHTAVACSGPHSL